MELCTHADNSETTSYFLQTFVYQIGIKSQLEYFIYSILGEIVRNISSFSHFIPFNIISMYLDFINTYQKCSIIVILYVQIIAYVDSIGKSHFPSYFISRRILAMIQCKSKTLKKFLPFDQEMCQEIIFYLAYFITIDRRTF